MLCYDRNENNCKWEVILILKNWLILNHVISSKVVKWFIAVVNNGMVQINLH